MRRRSEHREVARLRCGLRGVRSRSADAGRLRIYSRLRCRAIFPRMPADQDRARLAGDGPEFGRRARPRTSALILSLDSAVADSIGAVAQKYHSEKIMDLT